MDPVAGAQVTRRLHNYNMQFHRDLGYDNLREYERDVRRRIGAPPSINGQVLSPGDVLERENSIADRHQDELDEVDHHLTQEEQLDIHPDDTMLRQQSDDMRDDMPNIRNTLQNLETERQQLGDAGMRAQEVARTAMQDAAARAAPMPEPEVMGEAAEAETALTGLL